MNPIFKHGPSAQHRLILVLCFSALLIIVDHKTNYIESARVVLQSTLSPLQYLASFPKQLLNWSAENIVTRSQLIADNEQYKINELLFREQILQLNIIKRENDRLRALLASPLRPDTKKMVAEIVAVDSDPYTQQVVINRGEADGLYEGQAVIDSQGLVGQVLYVGKLTSRVLLITDVTHAVPVRIERNGIRLIASGIGSFDHLTHNFVPHSADVQEGDLLVTSGLGGVFPEGYPVAKVTYVDQDESRAFAAIESKPAANIDRLRYVLLLWTNNSALETSNRTPLDKNLKEKP